MMGMAIRFADSATRHRISNSRARHVVETTPVIIRQPAPKDSEFQGDRLVFLGLDRAGALLEVMAVEIKGGLLVIHAMKMRRMYDRHYRKGTQDAQPRRRRAPDATREPEAGRGGVQKRSANHKRAGRAAGRRGRGRL
jgi:hypothetical protein